MIDSNKKEHSVLFWNGEKIGTVYSPRVDNFDYYGEWQATENSELYKSFLETICTKEYGAYVEIGQLDSELTGNVLVQPDEEIDIKMYP